MSDAASGGAGSNLLTQWLDGVKSALGGAPDQLAKALGLFYAARAAVSVVASGVAAAATQSTINTANAKYQGVPILPGDSGHGHRPQCAQGQHWRRGRAGRPIPAS